MADRRFKRAATFVTPAVLILLGLTVYEAIRLDRPLRLPPLPSPNGYDDFLRAQDSFRAQSVELKDVRADELRASVTPTTAALQLIRLGLDRQCRAPLAYTPD